MMSKARREGEGDEGRASSSSSSSKDEQKRGGEEQYDDADYEPEPEEKISIVKTVAGVCLLGLVLAALGATVTELWPSHMAPQSIMSHAHDAFQADPDVSGSPGDHHTRGAILVRIPTRRKHRRQHAPPPPPPTVLVCLYSRSIVRAMSEGTERWYKAGFREPLWHVFC